MKLFSEPMLFLIACIIGAVVWKAKGMIFIRDIPVGTMQDEGEFPSVKAAKVGLHRKMKERFENDPNAMVDTTIVEYEGEQIVVANVSWPNGDDYEYTAMATEDPEE